MTKVTVVATVTAKRMMCPCAPPVVHENLTGVSWDCASKRLSRKLASVVSVWESKRRSKRPVRKQFARDKKHVAGAKRGKSGSACCVCADGVLCGDIMCCVIGVQQQLQHVAKHVATIAGRKACTAERIAWLAMRRLGLSQLVPL